jgi:hypothetical protein
MCNIEFTAFNVNGSANIPNCIAKTTDTITIDLGASFVSSETGVWTAWVAVNYNNGTPEYYSAVKNVTAGINDFIVPIPSTSGTIKVTEVSIVNASGTILCGGNVIFNPTMTNCQILTVSAPSTGGSIKFESNPLGAEIFIDNSDQKHITPYTITGIPAGTHSYRLTLLNYPDITGNVTVQENKIITVSADFTTGQVNVLELIVGLGVATILIGGLIYALRKPDTTKSLTKREVSQ